MQFQLLSFFFQVTVVWSHKGWAALTQLCFLCSPPTECPALIPPPQVMAPSMAGAGSGQALCLFTLHTSYFHASVFDLNSGHRDPFPHCDKSPDNLSCWFELPFKALVI